jgi:hypothetical protein
MVPIPKDLETMGTIKEEVCRLYNFSEHICSSDSREAIVITSAA